MPFDDRSLILLGEEGKRRLADSCVAVYGLGGVGAACALDLVRSGVGRIIAFDSDRVNESNLNRLAFGFGPFIGRPKAEVLAELAAGINGACVVEPRLQFLSGEGAAAAVPEDADISIDAIDSLNPKVRLLAELLRRDRDCFSSMGTAGRFAPERLRVGSLWTSKGCPLAREVRNRLGRLGIRSELTVVWSDEPPVPPVDLHDDHRHEAERPPGRPRKTQGSLPFVPQAAGHILASLAVRRLLGRL